MFQVRVEDYKAHAEDNFINRTILNIYCKYLYITLTMDVQRQFPSVHWIWQGGISFVYEVDPHIVVKIPKPGKFPKEQFRKEIKIYDIFSRNPSCSYILQCFLCTENGIFLEYMRDRTLSSRIQDNHIRDPETMIVTQVKRIEALHLRKQWMNQLAQAVAFLESLGLAHGDLRPENVLLDDDKLKLCDFDCTGEIGAQFQTCIAPYGRLLNNTEKKYGQCGTSGFLGPRTEQFALGSLYYLINYGFELYEDQCLTENFKGHGPKLVDLLQNMVFPKLAGDPQIDDIIDKCWNNKFATIAQLAAHTTMFLTEGTHGVRSNTQSFSSKKAFCEDLQRRGLLSLLASDEVKSSILGAPGESSNNPDRLSRQYRAYGLKRHGIIIFVTIGVVLVSIYFMMSFPSHSCTYPLDLRDRHR